MQTLSQELLDYMNGICCTTPVVPEYPIKVQGVFANQAAGDAYINSKLVSGTVLNSSFSGGLYTFEVAPESEVGNGYFGGMLTTGTSYEDLTGLITIYGTTAFYVSVSSIIKLGNGLTFANRAFKEIDNSTIEIGNFNATSTSLFVVSSSNSTYNFKGTIGSTTGDDSVFSSDMAGNGNIINTIVANETADGGNKEGDLLWIENNGGTVNYVL